MSHRSLFKKFFNLFTKNTSVVNSKNISETEAINLQHEYMAGNCNADNHVLPPYIDILKQLDAPKYEVFSAALYYLEQIAQNESRYKADILRDLVAYSQKKKADKERKDAVLRIYERIKSN